MNVHVDLPFWAFTLMTKLTKFLCTVGVSHFPFWLALLWWDFIEHTSSIFLKFRPSKACLKRQWTVFTLSSQYFSCNPPVNVPTFSLNAFCSHQVNLLISAFIFKDSIMNHDAALCIFLLSKIHGIQFFHEKRMYFNNSICRLQNT